VIAPRRSLQGRGTSWNSGHLQRLASGFHIKPTISASRRSQSATTHSASTKRRKRAFGHPLERADPPCRDASAGQAPIRCEHVRSLGGRRAQYGRAQAVGTPGRSPIRVLRRNRARVRTRRSRSRFDAHDREPATCADVPHARIGTDSSTQHGRRPRRPVTTPLSPSRRGNPRPYRGLPGGPRKLEGREDGVRSRLLRSSTPLPVLPLPLRVRFLGVRLDEAANDRTEAGTQRSSLPTRLSGRGKNS